MNDEQPLVLNLNSERARKARWSRALDGSGYMLLRFGIYIGLAFGVAVVLAGSHLGYLLMAVGLICLMPASWYKNDLKPLPVKPGSPDLSNRLSHELLTKLKPGTQYTPRSLFQAIRGHWQVNFLLNRFLIPGDLVEQFLSDDPADCDDFWRGAVSLADAGESAVIEPGHLAASMMAIAPGLQPIFTKLKFKHEDITGVSDWLMRVIELQQRERPFFGGIGRDWSNGYTPTLQQFGQNISLQVEASGGSNFTSLTESQGVEAMVNAFTQGTGGIGLVGDPGIGKTSHVTALAQRMLEDKAGPALVHHQIIALNPSIIIASAQGPGQLEQIVLTLINEAVHAGHIILFLDDAQLFFGSGPGSFDMTHILLPAVQSGRVRFIMAMTPTDWQHLRAANNAFAGLITPVMLTERPEADVMNVLEDTTNGLEYDRKVVVTYEALREAYRLSGRYDQETAYPGKAINLLKQALSHGQHGGNVITAESVQQAIEQTRGVKVGKAEGAEADTLLHLEEKIHERMINQVHAVSVISAALRRARAGVSSPNRPIGSFLFLGPTGVGKTELSKAIAAVYFGDEANMIRLDMSEYQQASDVGRLLDNGAASNSLLLQVRSKPFSVVLLDEIEKAHPNILNLMLQMLDEGKLTDENGHPASFKDCIIIATSNAGAQDIRQRVEQGQKLEDFEAEFTDQLINSGQFKPELLNRFDDIVLFRPLTPEELIQVVRLMLGSINKTLAVQNISVELTPQALAVIVDQGNDPRLGARPMRRMLQRAVEDGIAGKILREEVQPGDHVVMDVADLSLPNA